MVIVHNWRLYFLCRVCQNKFLIKTHMKNAAKTIILSFLVLFAATALIVSCSSKKDNNVQPITTTSDCMADNLKFTETKVTPYPGTVFINFNIQNTSTKNYNLATVGTKEVSIHYVITATDGSTYEGTQ